MGLFLKSKPSLGACFLACLGWIAGCTKSTPELVPLGGVSVDGVSLSDSGSRQPGAAAGADGGSETPLTVPKVSALVINQGEESTETQTVTVQVEFVESEVKKIPTGLKLILAEVVESSQSCEDRYKLGSLQETDWSKNQDTPFKVSAYSGVKKICAYIKDSSGKIDPTQGSSDQIVLIVANPPVITQLEVASPLSSPIVNFTIQDREGFDLAGEALSLSYTTDGSNWIDVGSVKTSEISCVQAESLTCTGEFKGLPSSSGFFRVRAIAKDRSGNLSAPVISAVQNVPHWSIYAGTNDRGQGGSGTGAVLFHGGSTPTSPFAVHPKTGDIYAIDVDGAGGLLKLSAQTGRVSRVIAHGGYNFPKSGALNSTLKINSSQSSIQFDRNGLLYLVAAEASPVYQLDLDKNTFRVYAGEPKPELQGDTPDKLSILLGGFTFDDDNSMIVRSVCGTSGWNTSTSTYRIMKITQNKKDFTADQAIHIAGNCVRAKPVSGTPAKTSPVSNASYGFGTLAAFGTGDQQVVYFQNWGDVKTYKVVGGKIYTAPTVPYGGNTTLSNQQGFLYVANQKCTPSFEPVDGKEDCKPYTGGNVSSDVNCMSDGILAAKACVNDSLGYSSGNGGPVYFADGPQVNSPRPYRIRMIDSSGIIRTVFGSTPMRADGIHRSALKANFAGIYYKSASEPNQEKFPAGLYFMDYLAMVLGRIDPSTGKVEVIWGNQNGVPGKIHPPNTPATSSIKMGLSYGGGDGMPLAFDPQGLPWMRVSSAIVTLDENREIIYRSGSWSTATLSLTFSQKTAANTPWKVSSRWQMAPDLSPTPGGFQMSVDGGLKNFALNGKELYLMGGYLDLNNSAEFAQAKAPVIKLFDFSKSVVRSVMGDPAAAGPVQSQTLPTTCFYNAPTGGNCFVYYGQKDQQLYYSDGQSIRYITKPSAPSESTLGTLLTLPADLTPKRTINNFTLYWDEGAKAYTRAYTIESTGKLYCYPLSDVGKSDLCKGLALGPNWPGASIARMANQLTWKDSNHLLISTPSGFIFEFEVN